MELRYRVWRSAAGVAAELWEYLPAQFPCVTFLQDALLVPRGPLEGR